MNFDADLCSVQEVRNRVSAAVEAQKIYSAFSQEEVDAVVKAVAEACASNAEKLAKMAVEETGFGVWQDKVLKTFWGSTMTYDSIKSLKTIGILNENSRTGGYRDRCPNGSGGGAYSVNKPDINGHV